MTARAATLLFAFAVAACAGPTQGPITPPVASGGGGMFGGGGAGAGTGGNGATTPPPSTPPPDGGTTTTSALGCNDYVACLSAAMSDADAMACDAKASATATGMLDAIDNCVLGYCEGDGGGPTRCFTDSRGNPVNLDGSPAFDAQTNAPTGDCGDCLDNGEAGLWFEPCSPADDPACNTPACSQQTAACRADM